MPGRDTVEIRGAPMPPFTASSRGACAPAGDDEQPPARRRVHAEHGLGERHVRGKVIGFRAWSIDGYRLGSANRRLHAHWRIGVNRAECLTDRLHASLLQRGVWTVEPWDGPAHDAPDPDCQCGLYAYHDPWRADAFRSGDVKVYGAVTAWGRMEVHADRLPRRVR